MQAHKQPKILSRVAVHLPQALHKPSLFKSRWGKICVNRCNIKINKPVQKFEMGEMYVAMNLRWRLDKPIIQYSVIFRNKMEKKSTCSFRLVKLIAVLVGKNGAHNSLYQTPADSSATMNDCEKTNAWVCDERSDKASRRELEPLSKDF